MQGLVMANALSSVELITDEKPTLSGLTWGTAARDDFPWSAVL